MSLHFLVAIVGALAAAAGTGMLIARCLRVPNAALVAWTVAILALTIALGAQALGYGIGYGEISFRAMELGAQLIAPLALALGLAELAGKSLTARFAARLLLSAVAIVTLVVLGTDPLGAATFNKTLPAANVYYQIFPNKLLEYVLAPATVIVALIAIGVTAARPRRDPAWRDALPPAAAASVAALMLCVPGIAALLKVTVPLGSLFTPLCILAAAATWFAGVQVGQLRLYVLRQNVSDSEWGTQHSWAGRPDATGDFDPVAADDEFGIYRGNGAHRQRDDLDYRGVGGYSAEPGAGGDRFTEEGGYDSLYRDEAPYRGEAPYAEEDGYPQDPGYRQDPAYPEDPGYANGAGYRDEAGYPQQGGYGDEAGYLEDARYQRDPGYPQAAGHAAAEEPGAPLFGQIAIYTLLEDRVDDFDRLTKQVVKQVQAQEPDTLVYIVHAVPSAPMQRILYEVYRDRAAYEGHKRQPYVTAFEADRRPYVLATNIIELGLQQAKVSPLPSVSDLLADTGFDLLADTGFGQPGYGPRSAAGPPGSTTVGGMAAGSDQAAGGRAARAADGPGRRRRQ
jgi:quinol monooxygenase YgiN